jgi:hypothetical protein
MHNKKLRGREKERTFFTPFLNNNSNMDSDYVEFMDTDSFGPVVCPLSAPITPLETLDDAAAAVFDVPSLPLASPPPPAEALFPSMVAEPQS